MMKRKIARIITILFVTLLLAACAGDAQPAYYPEVDEGHAVTDEIYEPEHVLDEYDEEPEPIVANYPELPGKIAVIVDQWLFESWNEHRIAWLVELQERYGQNNMLVFGWPSRNRGFTADETEAMIHEIAANDEIGVLIVHSAQYGTDHIISILRESRDDIFVVYLNYSLREWWDEDPPFRDNTLAEAAVNANLILGFDDNEWLMNFPAMAHNLGATTLVYFYNSVSWDWDEDAGYHVMITYERPEPCPCILCELASIYGLEIVAADTEDYIQCGSSYHMFMVRTIPPILEEHGHDIVLFGLDNERAFWQWLGDGFIYLPMQPGAGWFDLYPARLALELRIFDDNPRVEVEIEYDVPQLIEMIRQNVEERGMTGRIATPPISLNMLFPLAAAEYGVMWMQGEVPQDSGIDMQVLQHIMVDIIAEHTGLQNHGVNLALLEEDGVTYENYILVLLEHIVY